MTGKRRRRPGDVHQKVGGRIASIGVENEVKLHAALLRTMATSSPPSGFVTRSKLLRPRTRRWHPDEMVVPIARKRTYLWRGVGHDGEILDISAHYDRMIAWRQQSARCQLERWRFRRRRHDDESQEVREEDPGGRT